MIYLLKRAVNWVFHFKVVCNKMLRLAQLDTTAARIFGINIFVGVSIIF